MATLKLKDIKPNPNNPRLIKDDKFKKLVQSLKDFPEMLDAREIVVNKDHIILGGNMRYKAAIEAGIKELPVKIVDWSEDKQREFIIKDNVSGGEWDWSLLANEWDTELLDSWSLDLPADFGQEEVEEDEAPEVSSEPAVSKLGEIYQLGKHRIMCGDSTNKENVEQLMNGAKVDMVFTDPPYGVEYTGGQFYSGKRVKDRRKQIKNDATLIYDISLTNILDHIDNGAFYVCYASSFSIEVLSQLRDIGLERRAIIIWNKTNTGYSDLTSNYKNNYEPIFYGLKKGQKTNFRGDTKQTTVWSIDKPKVNMEHPTMKPIELCARAIQNSSNKDDLVLDLFLGSGSTLIACEQTNRICYGMELDPKYVDVIRKRYWKFINNNDKTGWEENTPLISGGSADNGS